MSSTVELVRARLVADTAVFGLVGSKIFGSVAPQTTLAPWVVMSVISDVPIDSFTTLTVNRLSSVRLQVDCYAKTYLGAHAIAEVVDAVINALASPDLSAWRFNSRDLFDDEAQLHRVSHEYDVFH